eukprot:scaffold73272_cov75-Phaeocystis_antarctica.AAC.2
MVMRQKVRLVTIGLTLAIVIPAHLSAVYLAKYTSSVPCAARWPYGSPRPCRVARAARRASPPRRHRACNRPEESVSSATMVWGA